MKIAIIGATGMIGHHTARAARASGHELKIVHRESSNLDALRDLEFESAVADLDTPESLSGAFAGCDAVLNCAAYYPTKPLPWKSEVETARRQMKNFLDACESAKVARIVYLGGAIALRRHPLEEPGTEDLGYPAVPPDKTPYVQVKYEMDKMALERGKEGLPVVVAIPSMCFGEHDKGPSTGRLIVEIANETLPGYIRGERNTVYTGDAGRGLILAAEKGKPGERYLLTGRNITMDELVPLIAKIAGVRPPSKKIPLGLAKTAARVQEWKYNLMGGELPVLSRTAIAVMASGQFLDGTKARKDLGFEARVSVDDAIGRALKWFRANGYVK